MSQVYVIPGKPVAWARPKYGKGHSYDSQASLKKDMRLLLLAQFGDMHKLHIDSIQILINFFMPMPTSLSMIKKKELVGKPHRKRPDLDNLTKLILDACQGVLFYDDCQIFSMHVRKIWDWEGKTTIQIVDSL
jgi:Holliday junction resolvase RusA-like endonuclease